MLDDDPDHRPRQSPVQRQTANAAVYRMSGLERPQSASYAYEMNEDDAARIEQGVRQLGRRMRAERQNALLGVSALGILGALYRSGPIPAARLAEEERLQPQSLTRLIADLECQGLIRRSRGRIDRRTLLIEITGAGTKALAEDRHQRRLWLDAALAGALTPAERALLVVAGDLMVKVANWPAP
jgi:DNA-binding MarR family transcriptional regulator